MHIPIKKRQDFQSEVLTFFYDDNNINGIQKFIHISIWAILL